MHCIILERKNTTKVLLEIPLTHQECLIEKLQRTKEEIDDSYPSILEQL